MFKNIALPSKDQLLVKLKNCFEILDDKFDCKDIISTKSSKDIYIAMRTIKSLCKKIKKEKVPIIQVLIPFCSKLTSYFNRSALAAVESFYLLEGFNAMMLTLVIQQQKHNAISITKEQFLKLESTVNRFDDPKKWADSTTCEYYVHNAKAILDHIQIQKNDPESTQYLEQTAQAIEFGSKVMQDIASKDVVAVSLDAISIAQKLLSILEYFPIDFDKKKHEFMFNCLVLTDTFLDDSEDEKVRDESKNMLIKLANQATSNTSSKDIQVYNVLAFSLEKVLLNLSLQNEKKDMYFKCIEPLLEKIKPETKFVILRKLLKCTDYEVYQSVQKELQKLNLDSDLPKTLKDPIAKNQSENRFLAKGTNWHQMVVGTYEKLEVDQDIFKPDKFQRTPLILALQMLNTFISEEKSDNLKELITFFLDNYTVEGLRHSDLCGQTCFEYFAQGNHVQFLSNALSLLNDDIKEKIFQHQDKNGRYMFHHFSDGSITIDTKNGFHAFVEIFLKFCANCSDNLKHYLSRVDNQKNSFLHMLSNRLKQLDEQDIESKNYINELIKDLILRKDVLITQNQYHKYFFNDLSSEQINILRQSNGLFSRLDLFAKCAFDACYNLSELNSSIESLLTQKDDLTEQEFKQNIEDLILNCVVAAPERLQYFDKYINKSHYEKMIEASLSQDSFETVCTFLERKGDFLLKANQVKGYVSLEMLEKVLSKCSDKVAYIKNMLTNYPRHSLFKKENFERVMNTAFESISIDEKKQAMAEFLYLAVENNDLENFQTFLKVQGKATANPNYVLPSKGMSCLSFVCQLDNEEQSIQFMNEMLEHSKHIILLSPLNSEGDLEDITPTFLIFKNLNSSLLDILVKRSFASLKPTKQTAPFWLKINPCIKMGKTVPVKTGLSITDVARCLNTLMQENYLTVHEKNQLMSPSFDAKENEKKLKLVKRMTEDLDKTVSDVDSKKKLFVRVLTEGVKKFNSNRKHLKYIISQLESIFESWQKDLNNQNFDKLKAKSNSH